MNLLKVSFTGLVVLAALASCAQIPVLKAPIHLLHVNELASERYTKLWVKCDADLKQYKRYKQLPNQLLLDYIRPQTKLIRLIMDSVAEAGGAYRQGFLINATNDTISIERADATI